jgi:hypothetical protein
MARKKAEKYLGNPDLLEGFEQVFTEYFGQLDPTGFEVNDTTDPSTAVVSFTFKRPLLAEVEAARKQLEELIASLGGDTLLPEGLIEGEFREIAS